MEHWLKRTWAEIDLDALSDNFRKIRAVVRPDCNVMGIVKADGYGHGAVACAKMLKEEGASWFGVSNIEEAIQLRQAGIVEPILILSYTPVEETVRLSGYCLTQAVVNAEYGRDLNARAEQEGVTVRVHLKVDTGMSRVGFVYRDAEQDEKTLADMAEVARLPHLCAEGIFTHFAVSDEPDGEEFTRLQFARFTEAIEKLKERGVTFALRHCCNSAATLRFPEMHLDMVRPGLILYGLMPSEFMKPLLPLRPVMSMKTRVSMVKDVPAGETVSYGRTYKTDRPTTIATVPVGYADGYSRKLSNKAVMLLGGKRVPICGRVCMDQSMLDVTDVPGVCTDMTAVAFGCDGDAEIPVEEFAAWSGTINYEAVCEIGKRVPRLFLKNGQVIGQLNYIV